MAKETKQQLVERCAKAGYEAAKNAATAELITGGNVSTLPKGEDFHAFDTDYIEAAGPNRLRLFSSNTFVNGAPGVQGTAKSRADFNLDSPGQFNSPNTFTQLGIKVTLLPDPASNDFITEDDFYQLKANTWLTYIAGQRPVLRYKLEQLSGAGLHLVHSTASAYSNLQFGSPAPWDWLRFGQPFTNRPNEQFAWTIETTSDLSMSARVRVRVALPGILQGAAG